MAHDNYHVGHSGFNEIYAPDEGFSDKGCLKRY